MSSQIRYWLFGDTRLTLGSLGVFFLKLRERYVSYGRQPFARSLIVTSQENRSHKYSNFLKKKRTWYLCVVYPKVWSLVFMSTSLVVWWSELLTTNHEVPGSIPGSTMGIFPCSGRIPVVTMVWVVSRIRLKFETSITRSHNSINSD